MSSASSVPVDPAADDDAANVALAFFDAALPQQWPSPTSLRTAFSPATRICASASWS